MKTITREELRKRVGKEKPDNDDILMGYALVNVLDQETFLDEHIPNSINIPKGHENRFGRYFDKSKEIILYCGSSHCTASKAVAEELLKNGFKNVTTYEGGMDDWREAGNQIERGEGITHEMRVA